MAGKHRTKVHQKDRNKNDQSCIWHIDKKIHLFWQDSTSGRTNQVRYPRLIHLLQLPSAKKEYVVINTPNRLKPDTKYIVTAPYCHWIWERSITVLCTTLICNLQCNLTRSIVKTAIKDAHTEEALHQRITEQECYTKLVQTITAAITDISEAENPSVGYKNKIDKINGVIEFIREKRVKQAVRSYQETQYSQTFRQQPKTQLQWTQQGTL